METKTKIQNQKYEGLTSDERRVLRHLKDERKQNVLLVPKKQLPVTDQKIFDRLADLNLIFHEERIDGTLYGITTKGCKLIIENEMAG